MMNRVNIPVGWKSRMFGWDALLWFAKADVRLMTVYGVDDDVLKRPLCLLLSRPVLLRCWRLICRYVHKFRQPIKNHGT